MRNGERKKRTPPEPHGVGSCGKCDYISGCNKKSKAEKAREKPKKNEGHKMDGGPSCSSQLHRILWHYFAAYVEHCFPERLRWRRLNSSTARYSHVPVINWLLAAHAIIEPSEMKSITR